MLYRDIVYDIYSSLKEVYDDAEISLYAVLFWTSYHADKLRASHIEKRDDTGAYLTQFPKLPILKDSITGRKYIELPEQVYGFDEDKGINYITYEYVIDDCMPPFSSVTFSHTTPGNARPLYWTEEEKPNPDNPYWYRVKDKIYFLGIESIDVQYVEAGLYTTFNPRNIVDLDVEMDFPQELLPVLVRQVLDLGRFVLMMPKDLINDGVQTEGAVPKTKILQSQDSPQNQNQGEE